MITQKQTRLVEQFVKSKLDVLNWMHTNSVRPIAKEIAKEERADKDIVDVAVLFHDIAKTDLKKELYHHKQGAEIAKKFLKKLKLKKEFIDAVYHCVLSHSTPLRYFKTKAKFKKKRFLANASYNRSKSFV